MKILLFANRVIEPVHSMTGIGRYVKELTLGIIAANKSSRWTYDLCAPGEGRQPGWLPADMGYRRVPGPRKLVHAAWTAIGAPRLERLVGTFDLIHALHPSYPIPTGGPAMITLHDLLPLRHPEWYRRDENLGFRRTLDVVGERGWGVIVNSEYVGRQVRELGTISPDRISVVHMAVGDEFRHPVDAVHVSAACASLGLTP
ncbi:MAG TPA: glycosyltransferase, partial [Acidimicrobiales bacterium]|nr:glycosyltransferase [Acidimicrobiales bacterium]